MDSKILPPRLRFSSEKYARIRSPRIRPLNFDLPRLGLLQIAHSALCELPEAFDDAASPIGLFQLGMALAMLHEDSETYQLLVKDKKEKVHNMRDYLRSLCYPLEQCVPNWPANPPTHPEPQESSFLTSRGHTIFQRDTQQRMCEDRKWGTCNDGDKRQPLQSWSLGDEISKLAQLGGHKKAVTGIALPLGSDKLYTASEDGDFRVWDCNTAGCAKELNLGSEIGCLTSNGSWIFAGLRDSVKAWNIQTATEYSLNGVVGQVYALETMGKDMLFAGMQNGSILVWKYISETNSFKIITTLKGHTSDVLSLKVGRQSLYSGSADNTIRRWNLGTLQCTQILTGHSAPIRSLLCWGNCFVYYQPWTYTEAGCLEVFHTHNEEHGVLALFGMHDADNKPILFCPYTDNSVHLYELPGGKIFAKQEVRAITSGPEGLFFTGDVAGGVAVWKWLHKQTAEAN